MSGLDAIEQAGRLSDAGRHADALEALDQARDGAPRHTARGWALENLARWGEARAAYDSALELDPDQVWARIGLANVLGRLGETDAAARHHDEVIARASARASEEPALFELLGWSLYQRGRLAEAIEAFRRGLTVDPGQVAVRFDLGLALLAAGRWAEAAAAYDAGLQTLDAAAPDQRRGPLEVALDDLAQEPNGRSRDGEAVAARLRRALDD